MSSNSKQSESNEQITKGCKKILFPVLTLCYFLLLYPFGGRGGGGGGGGRGEGEIISVWTLSHCTFYIIWNLSFLLWISCYVQMLHFFPKSICVKTTTTTNKQNWRKGRKKKRKKKKNLHLMPFLATFCDDLFHLSTSLPVLWFWTARKNKTNCMFWLPTFKNKSTQIIGWQSKSYTKIKIYTMALDYWLLSITFCETN